MIERRGKLDDLRVLADLSTSIDWLRSRPRFAGARVGSIGFCLGGTFVLNLAAMREDLATVCYYGFPAETPVPAGVQGPYPRDEVAKVSGPILAFSGDQDQRAGQENIAAYIAAVKAREIDFEAVVYPGLDHAFLMTEWEEGQRRPRAGDGLLAPHARDLRRQARLRAAAVGTVPRIPFEQLPPELSAQLRPRYERLGYLGEFFQVAASQPAALSHFVSWTEALKEAMDWRLAEAIALTVAAATGNEYERVQHERLSLKLGFEVEQVRALVGGGAATRPISSAPPSAPWSSWRGKWSRPAAAAARTPSRRSSTWSARRSVSPAS